MANPMLPKFDYESMIALQKANIETIVQTQQIMFDLLQTIAKRNAETMKTAFSKGETLTSGFDSKKHPQEYMDEAKAAMEKSLAEVKETMDLSMKAQNEVIDLLIKRATANIEEAKSLAG